MQNTVLTEGDIVRVPMLRRPAVGLAEEGSSGREGPAAAAGSSEDVIMHETESDDSLNQSSPLVYELLVSQV